jgi:hypothetical protein
MRTPFLQQPLDALLLAASAASLDVLARRIGRPLDPVGDPDTPRSLSRGAPLRSRQTSTFPAPTRTSVAGLLPTHHHDPLAGQWPPPSPFAALILRGLATSSAQ